MKKPLFAVIAAQASRYYRACNREDIASDAREQIERLVKNHMPSGSGIDHGVQFDFESSNPDKLIFITHFHHMNSNGFYDGWTDHKVTVTPSLVNDIDVRIGGRDRNSIKDYLLDTFRYALRARVDDGTLLVAPGDAAIAHLRAVLPEPGSVKAHDADANARVFLNRLDGDFSQ